MCIRDSVWSAYGQQKEASTNLRDAWDFVQQSTDTLVLNTVPNVGGDTEELKFRPKLVGRWKDKSEWVDSLVLDVNGDGKNEWLIQTRNRVVGLAHNKASGYNMSFEHRLAAPLRAQRTWVANGKLYKSKDKIALISFDHQGTQSMSWQNDEKRFVETTISGELSFCGLDRLRKTMGAPFFALPAESLHNEKITDVVNIECVQKNDIGLVLFVANGNELWADCRISNTGCGENQRVRRLLNSVGHAFAIGDTNNDGVFELYVTKDTRPGARDRVTVWELGDKGLTKNDSFSFDGAVKDIVLEDVKGELRKKIYVIVGKKKSKEFWSLN